MRRVRLAAFALLAVAMAALLAGWWAFGSAGGRDLLLDRAVAALPEGTLRVGAREGSFGGGLRLHDVVYEDAAVRIAIKALEVRPRAIRPLSSSLRFATVSLDGVTVQAKPAPDAPSPPWPEALPRFDLPVGITIDALRVRRLQWRPVEGEPVAIEVIEAALRLVDGVLAVDEVALAGAAGEWRGALRVAPDEAYATTARFDVRLAGGARFTGSIDGGLPAGRLVVEGVAGGAVRAQLDWTRADAIDALGWVLAAELDAVDTASLGLPAQPPLSVRLRARGGRAASAGEDGEDGHAIALEGRGVRAGETVEILPSRLHVAAGRLHAEPLALALLDGRLALRGHYGLDDGAMALEALAEGLGWGIGEGRVTASGTARLEGVAEAWQAEVGLDLRRGVQQARLDGRLTGRPDALVLAPFVLRTPGGRVEGDGRFGRDAAAAFGLDARVQGFDPAWVFPGWPGRLEGTVRLEGAAPADAPLRFDARVEGLRGPLRGQALAGRLALRGEGETLALALDLAAGEGTLRADGRVSPAFDLAIDARQLALAPWVEGLQGQLDGRLRLVGESSRLGMDADLQLRDAAFEGAVAERVSLRGDWPSRGEGTLALRAEGLAASGITLRTLVLQLEGRQDVGRFRIDATAPDDGLLVAQGDWRAAPDFARGILGIALLRAEAPSWPPLRLASPARVAWSPSGVTLPAPLCLQLDGDGQLCAEGDSEALALRGQGLRPQWLAPLFQDDRNAPLPAMPSLALVADWQRTDDGQAIQARLAAEGLRFDARARVDADGAIDGQLEVAATDLTLLELVSDDIASPAGTLSGRLAIAGSVEAPRWQGRLTLAPFSVELPALGIAVREGRVALEADDAGRLRIEGRLPTGDGALDIAGGVAAAGAATTLTLRGTDVRVLDTPDGQAWISPELDLRIADGVATLRGRVELPRADLRLDRFEQDVGVSPDVVVVDDPAAAPAAAGPALDADLRLVLGDAVRLRGFGFDGRLAGELGVRDRIDREPRARGALSLSGELRAYGQRLALTRGALRWANAPLDEPMLDVLAERPDSTPRVGVALTGSALSPVADVWSDPPLPQAEALSWLMFGRPLASADGGDAAQLQQAAASLGGSALAQAVAGRVGLDAASVGESSALGGTALTVGKRLTPKLYVSYGLSLTGAGQVVTVTYALRRWLAAKLEGGVETRLELEATLDRD